MTLDSPIFIEDGRAYVPIRFISEEMNANVKWNNEEKAVKLFTENGDIIKFFVDSSQLEINNKMYVMDATPFIRNARTYLPVRHFSEVIHADIRWDSVNRNIHIQLKDGTSIEEALQTSEYIEERNGLKENKVEHPDFMLLAKLIHAEAEAEPYKGKLAVGNVVLNRVTDSRFPNTITGVIYQENQFTPVKTGRIDRIVPNADSLKAAEETLLGVISVEDALFFFNPSLTGDTFLRSRPYVVKIGNHQFTK